MRGRILFGWLLVSAVLGLAVTALGQSQRYFPPASSGSATVPPLDAGVLVVNQVVADAGTISGINFSANSINALTNLAANNALNAAFTCGGTSYPGEVCLQSNAGLWSVITRDGTNLSEPQTTIVTGTLVADAGSVGYLSFPSGNYWDGIVVSATDVTAGNSVQGTTNVIGGNLYLQGNTLGVLSGTSPLTVAETEVVEGTLVADAGSVGSLKVGPAAVDGRSYTLATGADPESPSVSALFLYQHDAVRLYFTDPTETEPFYSLNFAGVNSFENVPGFTAAGPIQYTAPANAVPTLTFVNGSYNLAVVYGEEIGTVTLATASSATATLHFSSTPVVCTCSVDSQSLFSALQTCHGTTTLFTATVVGTASEVINYDCKGVR